MKRQSTEWEKIFANNMINKRLISNIQTTHKAQYQKIKNPVKSYQRSKCAFRHRRYRDSHKVQEETVRIISS